MREPITHVYVQLDGVVYRLTPLAHLELTGLRLAAAIMLTGLAILAGALLGIAVMIETGSDNPKLFSAVLSLSAPFILALMWPVMRKTQSIAAHRLGSEVFRESPPVVKRRERAHAERRTPEFLRRRRFRILAFLPPIGIAGGAWLMSSFATRMSDAAGVGLLLVLALLLLAHDYTSREATRPLPDTDPNASTTEA